MDQQLSFAFTRVKRPRGRPVDPSEIRTLYLQFRDIKRVSTTLKIHERRVRPHVQDLVRAKREPRERIPTGMPAGMRWRCACCGVTCTVEEDQPEPMCHRGTRAPWLPAPNPFTDAERKTVRRPIDPYRVYR